MTTHRTPTRLPDAPWLLVAFVVIVVGALLAIALGGSDNQRFARERRADVEAPRPVQPGTTHDIGAATLARIPPEVARAAAEWPLPNHDYGNTRATTTAKINASNVRTLGVAWLRKLNGAGMWGAAASGALIANRTVFFQDLTSDVFALDADTGAQRWVAPIDQAAYGPNGPAIGYGKVYVQDGSKHVVALNIHSGQMLWRSSLGGPTGQQQPSVFGGLVYTGIAAGGKGKGPGDAVKTHLLTPGSSGFAYGVDAATGRVVWEFQTVEKGFWGDVHLNAGAGVWMTPAVDTRDGTTFWSTGNPVPAPGTIAFPNASTRPGRNLYSDTMLALDGQTGKLRWFNQVIPHDMFHHDFQNPPVLTESNGRQLVIGSGKMGVVYAFDRATGKLLWQTPVGRHQNDKLKKLPLHTVVNVYPGFWGGIETPIAVARDGVVYALTENLSTPYTATAWGAKDGEEAVHNLEGRTRYDTGTSALVALDVATGKIKWTHPFPTVGFGAATVVNDLVFTATYDGMIYALRRDTGAVAWKLQAPGGINAWPAVAGDTVVWPIGLGRQPVLLALRLGGKPSTTLPRARPAAKQP